MKEHEKLINLKTINKVLFITILLCCCNESFSQKLVIKGIVRNELSAPLVGATVLIVDSKNKIILYKISDANGNFIFNSIDTIQLKNISEVVVRFLGYTEQRKTIIKDINTYIFNLSSEEIKINEVTVSENLSVKRSGDTTSYNVKFFSNKTDRSIGDVITRLPGMVVTEEGRIKYKDKDIAGLLIQGDNLLEENYGIGTKSINKDMIKNIQVIERFQPIRTLSGRKVSNSVAINLVLKNENATQMSGVVNLGIGLPNLVDINASGILFNKKIKTLLVTKYNNVGEVFLHDKTQDIINDAVVTNPGIPEKYVNKNNSLLNSINYLKNFKDSIQLRLNFQFNYDFNKLNYSLINENFTINDTVSYRENQDVIMSPKLFTALFTLSQNKSANFFENKLVLKFANTINSSQLNFNSYPLYQKRESRYNDLLNHFKWIPLIKSRKLLEIYHDFKYQTFPQVLLVQPGIDSSLNNGLPSKSILQSVQKKILSSEVTFSYLFNKKHIVQKSLVLGLSNEFQNLQSELNIEQYSGAINPYLGDSGNSILWQKHQEYISAGVVVEKPYFKLRASLPLMLQQIHYNQPLYSLVKSRNSLLFNPDVYLEYFFGQKHYVSAMYIINNIFGSVNDIFKGGILRNFKEFKYSGDEVQHINQQKFNLSYNYINTLRILNASLGVTYVTNRADLMYSMEYLNNIIKTVIIPFKNRYSSVEYNAFVSKYLTVVKSKLELNTTFSRSFSNQVVNNVFLPYENNTLSSRLTFGLSLIDYVSFYYSGSLNLTNGKLKEENGVSTSLINKVLNYNHNYSLVVTPKFPVNIIFQASQQLNVWNEIYRTHYFFADIKARYLLTKPRIEFEADASNIFNVYKYETSYISLNQFYTSNYFLRGRLLLLKANFIF